MKRTVLLTGAALLVVAATAAAQGPADQRMAFGGGSQFEFVIPVNALGHVWAEVTWAPDVPMHAYLFAPGRSSPVAEADGAGRLTISSRVAHWWAGRTWMLRVVGEDRSANVRGALRLVWPAGNRPGAVTLWQNAGPTDAAVLAQAANRIRAVRARVAASDMIASTTGAATLRAWDRAAYLDLLDVLQTRIDVLSHTPSRYVRNDATVLGVPHAAPGRQLTGPQALAVGFSEIRVQGGSAYHVDHESDAPYVVSAILAEDGSPVSVGRTAVMPMLHVGEVRHALGGGQELARANGAPARLAIAVLEREHGNADQAMAQFLRAVELFTLYRVQPGSTSADADFPWLVAVAAEATGEALIGAPQLLGLTADGVCDCTRLIGAWQADANGGRHATPALVFDGNGAKVQVILGVAAAQR